MKQIMRFGIVGIALFVVDYALLCLFTMAFHIQENIAAAMSFTTATILNYWLSKVFVFETKTKPTAGEFSVFLIGATIGLALTETIMTVITYFCGTSPFTLFVVKCLATGCSMVWNFLSRKTYFQNA